MRLPTLCLKCLFSSARFIVPDWSVDKHWPRRGSVLESAGSDFRSIKSCDTGTFDSHWRQLQNWFQFKSLFPFGWEIASIRLGAHYCFGKYERKFISPTSASSERRKRFSLGAAAGDVTKFRHSDEFLHRNRWHGLLVGSKSHFRSRAFIKTWFSVTQWADSSNQLRTSQSRIYKYSLFHFQLQHD